MTDARHTTKPQATKSRLLRTPPQNIDAERALIGAIILKPDTMHDVSITVYPESFFADKHREIFRAILDLFTKGNPLDILSLTTKLREREQLERIGGASYLTELVETVPAAGNATFYAEMVQQKAVLRGLINAADDIAEMAYSDPENIDETMDTAEKKVFQVTNAPTSQKFTPISSSLAEAWERFELLNSGEHVHRGIPTGFAALDDFLSGLQKSDLVILAARPSMGKTTLALDIARNAACKFKKSVGVFSLEMSAQQLVDRMLAAEAQVDAWKLRTGRLSNDHEFEAVQSAMARLSEAPIHIDDQPGNNILKMRSAARRLKNEHGLDLLVVDYLQLMSPTATRASDSLVQQITEISRSLKILARELDVPVLALSQLSRAVEQRGGKPRLSDLRDSGCLLGDTKITNARTGAVHTIEELAARANQTPVPVFAADTQYRVGMHDMIRVFHSGRKRVYTLQTRSGRTITASANHPFLQMHGWTRLDKLSRGDRIALPRTMRVMRKTSALTKDELILLAHLIGDGCILPKQPYHYTSAHRENIEAVRKAAHTLFNINGKTVRQKNWEHLYLQSPYRLAPGKKHPITLWFERLGLARVRSYEKRLPDKLFESSEEDLALFLRHLFATDGNVSWKRLHGRKPAAAIYYATSSPVLAEQVHHLLLRLGIPGALRKASKNGTYRQMYHVQVEGAGAQIRFLQNVGIADRRAREIPAMLAALEEIEQNTNTDTIPADAWRLVVLPAKESVGIGWRGVSERLGVAQGGSALQRSGMSRGRMMAIAQALHSPHCKQLAESDVFWDTIVSIEPLGVRDVYDATVPGVHNFVANDIVVHNSIEQDADVVMFIHREDKMSKDGTSDRPNIAEILVEKHRNGPVGKAELYFDEKHVRFLSLDTHHAGADAGADTTADDDF